MLYYIKKLILFKMSAKRVAHMHGRAFFIWKGVLNFLWVSVKRRLGLGVGLRLGLGVGVLFFPFFFCDLFANRFLLVEKVSVAARTENPFTVKPDVLFRPNIGILIDNLLGAICNRCEPLARFNSQICLRRFLCSHCS